MTQRISARRQIVTTGRFADREFGRVRLSFITSATAASRPVVSVNTPTGTMKVSTLKQQCSTSSATREGLAVTARLD